MAAYAGKHGENVVANIIAEAQGNKASWKCFMVLYSRWSCVSNISKKCFIIIIIIIIIISDEGLQDSFRWNVGTCGEM